MRSTLVTLAASAAVLLIAGCNKGATTPAASTSAPAAAATPAAPVAAAPAPSAQPGPAMGVAPAATAAPAAGAGAMAGLPKIKVACAADIQKFCAGSTEKPGKCLRPHKAELSQQCSQAIAERRAARMAERNGGGQNGAE